ncbi:hypothetical protein UY3_16464 [Chelonia mydas]|uniref:UPAR/Ly6 domain-containing protein n=1 Tax=Chelonia mydas TaxID=8469 RepID=M7B2W8_CHEMY|nr:hypothetical protein UY3_16464 [Chelonia mydas]
MLGGGGAISCYNCTSSEGYNCTTDQATCPGTVNSCITIACIEEQGEEDKEKTVYEKKCNSDDRLCNQFYGLTAGAYRLRWNATCCRADRCNLPEITLQPSSGGPNGLQCPSCFARGSDVCVPREVLNCTGLQTQCIQFAATAGPGTGAGAPLGVGPASGGPVACSPALGGPTGCSAPRALPAARTSACPGRC